MECVCLGVFLACMNIKHFTKNAVTSNKGLLSGFGGHVSPVACLIAAGATNQPT